MPSVELAGLLDLRFGVTTGQARPFADMLEDWLYIEELGFENAWLFDHVAPDFLPDGPWLEGWTTLAALAARTSRIRIGTAVTNAALRNPAVLSKQAITVDQVSGGRLEMAIGAGYYESEHRMLGIDYADTRIRAERLREAVQVVDAGLRGERVTLNGQHWKIDRAPMLPGCVQQPRAPLWVAAQVPFSLRTASLHADVLITMGDVGDRPVATLPKLRSRFARLGEMCVELGRDPAQLRRAYLVGFSDDRPYESDEAFTEFVGSYAEVGVTDFMIGLKGAGGRPGLERIAELRERVANA